MVLESQLPHKIVSLLLTMPQVKRKVDDFAEKLTPYNYSIDRLCKMRFGLEELGCGVEEGAFERKRKTAGFVVRGGVEHGLDLRPLHMRP